MTSLLEGRFAPITDQIGFVEAAAEDLADWWVAWEPEDAVYRKTRLSGSFAAILAALLPLAYNRSRVVFVPTRSLWTACFDNRPSGSDVMFIRVAAQDLATRAVRAVSVPDARIFSLYEPKPGALVARTRRSIGAVDDDPWAWDVLGDDEPLPFEELDSYRKRRIADRLTHEMMQRYLHAIGIDAYDDDFYAPDKTAYLVQRETRFPGDREITREQAQARRNTTS